MDWMAPGPKVRYWIRTKPGEVRFYHCIKCSLTCPEFYHYDHSPISKVNGHIREPWTKFIILKPLELALNMTSL